MMQSFSQFLTEWAAEPELVDLQEALSEEEFTQLEESLGNLASLGVGNLINVFKQSVHASMRGSNITASTDGSRFNQFPDWRPGQGSQIKDIGTIKSWKDIRKAFKKDPAVGAAVYFNGKPYLVANFGYSDNFSVNDSFVVAVDSTVLTGAAAEKVAAWVQSAQKYQNIFNAKKTGVAIKARELEQFIDKVVDLIGSEGRMTAKIISADKAGAEKGQERRSSSRRNDPLADRQDMAGKFNDPLKQKLSDFKASKVKDSFSKGETDKILDFILKNPGKKFAIDGKLKEAKFSRTSEGWEDFITGNKVVRLPIEGDGYHDVRVKIKDGKLVVA